MLKSNQPKYNSAINSNRRAWPGQGKEVEDIKTGGPAFPFGVKHTWDNYRGESSTLEENEEGMTLRDYFAAKAMPAVYRAFWDDVAAGRRDCVPEDWKMGIALEAYGMADAMLAAREGGAK